MTEMDFENFDWERLESLGFTEKATGELKSACWKGYTAVGMKTKNGKKVPNCVPVKKDAEHSEGDIAAAKMTASYLPKEGVDFFEGFDSGEANCAMAINQLRVMREKIDIMLGMLMPDDNLEPWCASKLTMSSQNLASVADFLRFGVET
jgi:hypothetical protein